MSPVRERFINIIETLPYDIDEGIYNKKTLQILKDVTQRYVDTYGIDDLSDEDKEVIHNVLEDDFSDINKAKTNF